MMKEVLKNTQPIFYQTLYRTFQEHKVPHAFLLCAKKGIDLHQAAMFIAKSIICENDVLACETCNDCMRLENYNYVDFKHFDGREESIKKRHIEEIQEEFAKSSVEGGAKIYMLENIDYATPEAMNSLLKMLEEPTEGIYAILTCENQNRVLPTIQSRSQVIHFRAVSQHALADLLRQDGMKAEDANILSSIYDSTEKIKAVEADALYHELKTEALNFVEDYFTKRENLLINAQTHVLKAHNDKTEMQFFLDLLLVLFKDVLYHAYGLEMAFVDHLNLIDSFKADKDQLIMVLESILKTKEAIKSNANLMLLMDRFIYEL